MFLFDYFQDLSVYQVWCTQK